MTKFDPIRAAELMVCSVYATSDPRQPVYFCSTPITGVPVEQKHKYSATIDNYRYRLSNVIDPTLVSVPGWTNDDYNAMWGHVIREIEPIMIFADGWQNSEGCRLEAKLANELGLKTLNHKLNNVVISIDEGENG